jgi:hypothetical protein
MPTTVAPAAAVIHALAYREEGLSESRGNINQVFRPTNAVVSQTVNEDAAADPQHGEHADKA